MIDWTGKSLVLKDELEQRYGFLGGAESEWAKYLRRGDLPPGLWAYRAMDPVKPVGGVGAVRKKDPSNRRALIMAFPADHAWPDVRGREGRGLGGGGALSMLWAPDSALYSARCDESNAFSSIVTPEWMRPWMGAPSLAAQGS